jgi:PAS domain S-box-containing protein
MNGGEMSKDAPEHPRRTADLEAAVAKANEAEERYRVLFENLGDPIFVADAETGQIVDCNKEAEVLLGRTRDEITVLHQTDLHAPEERDEWRQRFHQTIGDNSEFLESEIVTKRGSRVPVSISASVVMLGGKKHVLGIFRDISARKRAEADRERLEHQLMHAQKMDAIGALAGGIAHDFNMDGQECFALLKALDPNVKVVIATGHAREGVAQNVLDEGALQFVQKPFVKADLARAVSKALRGSCA